MNKWKVLKVMQNIGDRLTIKQIMEEVNTFLDKLDTEEYEEDVKNELEGIS